MNKKAFISVLMALAVPLICYFIVKKYSEDAVTMPRHYVLDTVLTKTVKGKEVTDTVWSKIPDFTLLNQMGDTVSLHQLKNKIIIADFFFTHCPNICPGMTVNMRRLQRSLNNAQRVGDQTNREVHFLSFTVDPERDSTTQLKKWADRFQINPDTWWLLTGNKKEIYDLASDMVSSAGDGHGIDTNFFHSDRFVLIDSNHYIRGFYRGLDSASLAQLSSDLVLLTLEKDKTKKSFLEGKLQLLAVVFLLTIAAVGLFLLAFKKNNKTHVNSGPKEE